MQKLSLTLALLFVSITNVSAAQIVYTLNDVNFSDGATASGTFTYDTDPGPGIENPGDIPRFVDINITTTNGVFLGDSYSGYTSGDDTAGYSADFGFVSSGGFGNVLIFNIDGFRSDLANGGTFVLQTGSQEYARSQTKSSRYVTSGSISAVPIPAAAWLFGSGLLGLAGLARRKKA